MRRIARQPNIRELILDGVDVMLARFGYRKMTMEDLARQVGIGKGTIYLHFPGKEELALAHVDRIVERLLQRLREISASPDSPPERIRAMLVTRVLFRFDSVVHYSQNLNDLLSAVRKELLVRRQGHFEKEAQELAKVLAAGREQGVFSCPDSRSTARAAYMEHQFHAAVQPDGPGARQTGRTGGTRFAPGRVAAARAAPASRGPQPNEKENKNGGNRKMRKAWSGV